MLPISHVCTCWCGRTKVKKNSSHNERGSCGLTGDGNAAEPQASLHVEDVLNVMVRGKDHGVGNKAIFMALDGADHSGLRDSWLIVMYNADAAQQLHVAKGRST